VCAVKVSFALRELVISLNEVLQPLGVHRTNGLRQISVYIRVLQVKDFRLIIFQNPGEDGVLSHILRAPLGVGIDDI